MNRKEFLGGLLASAAVVPWKLPALAGEIPMVPAYYDGFLASAVAKINRNRMNYGCEEAFFFITDLHIRSNRRKSGYLLARLIRETGIRKVLCGGDLTEAFADRYPTDKMAVDFAIDAFRKDWVDPIKAAGGNLYVAKGNHDFTVRHSMSGADAKKGFTYPGLEAKRIIIDEWSEKNIVSNPDDKTACYYYFDVPAVKVRYVVADTTDSEDAGDTAWGVKTGMHSAQLRWLAGTALQTVPAGYSIVVMHHIPLTDVAGSAKDREDFLQFRTLLECYQNRCVFELDGDRYDFSKAGGWIAMDITGHHHGETLTYENGIMHISEPCDAAYRDYIYRSAFCGKLPRKDVGTVNEQTFDVVQLDLAHHRAFMTRIGGGQDRVVHLKARNVQENGDIKIKPIVMDHVSAWKCYDGDKATRKPNPENKWSPLVEYHNDIGTISPDGIFSSKRKGVSIAVALDEALNKEIIPVQCSVPH